MVLLKKAPVLLGLLILASLPMPAQEAGAERFRLIGAERAQSLNRKLRSAAAEGYHVIAAGRGPSVSGKGRVVLLMEKNETAEQRREYAVLTSSGKLDDAPTAAGINALAAKGYRLSPEHILPERLDDLWVTESTYEDQVLLILERPPGPDDSAYAYDSFSYETAASFTRELSSSLAKGYEPMGIVNSARRLRIVLEKRPGRDGPASGDPGERAGRYRILLTPKRLAMKHALKRAAKKGYRVVDMADPSIYAPPMLLLQKRDDPPETYRYKLIVKPGKKIRKSKLERKLNKRARKGFHVTPGAITRSAVVLQRPPGPLTHPEYRALSSTTAPGISATMEAALSEGFRLVTIFVTAGETTVLLEKPGPAL